MSLPNSSNSSIESLKDLPEKLKTPNFKTFLLILRIIYFAAEIEIGLIQICWTSYLFCDFFLSVLLICIANTVSTNAEAANLRLETCKIVV